MMMIMMRMMMALNTGHQGGIIQLLKEKMQKIWPLFRAVLSIPKQRRWESKPQPQTIEADATRGLQRGKKAPMIMKMVKLVIMIMILVMMIMMMIMMIIRMKAMMMVVLL